MLGQELREHSGLDVPRSGERGQGAGPQDAGPWWRMWPSLSQSGPAACQLASGASVGTAGASGHLLQAVPRVPPGTSGQSSITPATSGPSWSKLRRPIGDGPDFHGGKSLRGLSGQASPGLLEALHWHLLGLRKSRSPTLSLFCTSGNGPRSRDFFANLSGNPPSSRE